MKSLTYDFMFFLFLLVEHIPTIPVQSATKWSIQNMNKSFSKVNSYFQKVKDIWINFS